MLSIDIVNWTLVKFLGLLVIMTRVGPLLFFMPITGSNSVPVQVKILFTLMTSLVLLSIVNLPRSALPDSTIGFALLIVGEMVFGIILALFARLVFAAVETAGQMVGIQMGMGVAGVMDPQFGVQVGLIGYFWSLIAFLIFLGMDGHHFFFRTMAESFAWVSPGNIHITQATFNGIIQGAGQMFVLAVKIMAPASAAIFFTHVAMGIIAKTVPQIPILIVGLPLNIAVGLIFIGLSLNFFLPVMINNFETLGRLLPKLAMGMGG